MLIKMRELGPWRLPDITLRDRLALAYASLDTRILWLTATKGGPALAVRSSVLAEGPD